MSDADAGLLSAIAAVRRRLQQAADRGHRDPSAVTLVAVTKTVEVSRMAQAIAFGLTDIGENRVQEAVAKRAELGSPARWHLIGHLQTNKARQAAITFDAVHSIDSSRVAIALDRHRPPSAEALEVLIEVELTGIPGRSGVVAAGLRELVAAVAELGRLRLTGLMTVAPPAPHPEAARPYFRRLRELRDELMPELGRLSMGMSDDFEVAVEEGATLVRVGRAIFGARPPAGRPGEPPTGPGHGHGRRGE
ncbi:MAG: YggS family pyridoxal phosphate-dependent enzyme [Candidatus Dormibacteria bacterium]